MEKQIQLKILSPENVVLEQLVKGIILPGSDGSFGVYPDHAPIVSKLKEGNVVIEDDKDEKTFEIGGGFFYLHHNNAILLTNTSTAS